MFLDCKKLVFGLLKIDITKVTSGSEDPSDYTHAQIDAIINSVYQTIAINNKCNELNETITVTTGSQYFEQALPTNYLDTIFVASNTTKEFLEPLPRPDFDAFTASGTGYYSIYGSTFTVYNATTTATANTYRHSYWGIPTALTADIDTFLYPLSAFERLIALGAVVDLMIYDTSQSVATRKNDVKLLYDEALVNFQSFWNNKISRLGGVVSGTRLIAGY